MALEQKIKYVWDFIINRNDVELIYRHNYAAFWLMWHIETNANFVGNLLEGLLYGTLPLLQVPSLLMDY